MDNVFTGSIVGALTGVLSAGGLQILLDRIKEGRHIEFPEYGLLVPAIFLWVCYVILLFQPEWSGKCFSIFGIGVTYWFHRPN